MTHAQLHERRRLYPEQYQAPDASDPSAAVHGLVEAQQTFEDTVKRTLTLVARTKKILDGANIAAWARILPWGMGEAATALDFFVEALQ
jgi:hypothetical protein